MAALSAHQSSSSLSLLILCGAATLLLSATTASTKTIKEVFRWKTPRLRPRTKGIFTGVFVGIVVVGVENAETSFGMQAFFWESAKIVGGMHSVASKCNKRARSPSNFVLVPLPEAVVLFAERVLP